MKTLVLYHRDADGFCSAWLIHRQHSDWEFVDVQYGEEAPDVTGRNVVIVDFSYKRPVLLEMYEKAESLIVLDHHKTAQAELEGLDFCVFDMDKSGCRLAWEWLCPDQPAPWLVRYVEDRDLWRFKLPHSQEVNAAIASYPHSFEEWSRLAIRPLQEVITEGAAILRYQKQLVRQIAKDPIEIELDGHSVLCVNTPILQSEIGKELAQGHPFGVVWHENKHGRKYSLRSTEGGVDVSEIARRHGGGGHRNAAGYEEY